MADHDVPSEAQLEALIDALAPLLNISIERERRAGVLAHLRHCFDLTALLLDFPMDERAAPAPVSQP